MTAHVAVTTSGRPWSKQANRRRPFADSPKVHDNPVLATYLAYESDNKHLSPATVRAKTLVIGQLIQFLATRFRLPVDDPDVLLLAELSDLLDWQRHLRIGVAAKAVYTSHVRGVYAWTAGRRSGRLLAENPAAELPVPRVPHGVPRPIEDDHLYDALDLAVNSDLRIYCWLMLAAGCGFRCSEIAGLDERAVRVDERTQTVLITVRGKGGKTRVRDGGVGVLGALRPFLRTGGPLFTTTDRATGRLVQISAATLSRYLNRWLHHEAGIQDTAHSLRHWFASSTVRERKNLRATQEALGHENLGTTARYVAVVEGHGGDLGQVTDRLLTTRGGRMGEL